MQSLSVGGYLTLLVRFVAAINALGNRPQRLGNLDGVNV